MQFCVFSRTLTITRLILSQNCAVSGSSELRKLEQRCRGCSQLQRPPRQFAQLKGTFGPLSALLRLGILLVLVGWSVRQETWPMACKYLPAKCALHRSRRPHRAILYHRMFLTIQRPYHTYVMHTTP